VSWLGKRRMESARSKLTDTEQRDENYSKGVTSEWLNRRLAQLSQLASIKIFFGDVGLEKARQNKGGEFESGCSVDPVSFQAAGFA
jgi:hypothetical protein